MKTFRILLATVCAFLLSFRTHALECYWCGTLGDIDTCWEEKPAKHIRPIIRTCPSNHDCHKQVTYFPNNTRYIVRGCSAKTTPTNTYTTHGQVRSCGSVIPYMFNVSLPTHNDDRVQISCDCETNYCNCGNTYLAKNSNFIIPLTLLLVATSVVVLHYDT